ncbi:MAG: AAA family ATPase, partial [Longimicrobiales bacterium]|nr:AAA family ATPase [Longimicrobiales bacterium]
ALVIGLPGTGKSALVYEFARLLVTRDSSVPERLRDHDIFELSPIFLRSGASHVGQYEERVSALLRILTANPKVILFVDEAHSMFQSGMEHRGPFTDANEAFKQAIMNGEITVIGCTTTAEYRHYIKPDAALDERFTKITIEEPTPEKTKEIMHARRPGMEQFYGVEIPDELIDRTVQLAEEYLLGRAQPRKSIQLLDGACAYCVIEDPPLERLTEPEIWRALEDTIGHSIVRDKVLDPEEIFQRLRKKIVGQDEALSGISRAFVMGVKGWNKGARKPRGVFLFSGPTGVGKTETAVLLSRVIGGGKEALLRVDCNTLKGSGHDGGPAQNVLFGPPPGYIGYVRGKGGVLSHIRDHPECIVLFDEIEKADPNVGELLFRVIDDGQCEDKEGNPLDFRRSFIVFTTNAGAVYHQEKTIGFGPGSGWDGPVTDPAAMKAHFNRMGLGEAFLGRIGHFFDFHGLDADSAREILRIQLEGFAETAAEKGYALEWSEEVLDHLVSGWEPGLGARDVGGILRNRVVEQVVLADVRGEMDGVKTIRLEVLKADSFEGPGELTGLARRAHHIDTLVISLA